MKNESLSSTTILLTVNILLVLIGLLLMNKRILSSDEKSDSLQTKVDQIETQLDVLIDDAKTAKEKVIVANEDFIHSEMIVFGGEENNCKKLSNFYCLLYTSPSPRDGLLSRMPSSA